MYYPNNQYNNYPTMSNYNSYQQMQQNNLPNMQNNMLQQNNSTNITLQGQQVNALEQVRNFNIPFDGSITYFPNTNGEIIYTKQLNMDGTVGIKAYKLDNEILKKENNTSENFVSREEFDKVKNTLDELLKNLGGVTKNESK